MGPGPDPEPYNSRSKGSGNREGRDSEYESRPGYEDRGSRDYDQSSTPYGPRGRFAQESDPRDKPSAYRPSSSGPSGFFSGMGDEPPAGGFGERNPMQDGFAGSTEMTSRPFSPDYSGYKVITG